MLQWYQCNKEAALKLTVNRNLGLLLSGQLVSQVGDKFYLLALSFWVLNTTQSPAMMGIVLACSLFPSLVFGFVSGAFIDRYDRKAIIVGTDMIRGVVIGIVAAAYYLDALSLSLILVSQVVLSINAAFFDPTIPAIIPRIVKRDQLTKANSQTQFIRGISSITGPVLGGVAVAAMGYGFAFVFNAVSFLVSAFFELFIKIPPVDKTTTRETSIKHEILEGYKYILKDKGLIIVLIMVGIIHFFVGSIEVLIPVLANSLTGKGAENLGFIQTALGVGAVLMALVISIRTIDGKEVRYLFSSVFLIGLGFIFTGVLFFAGIVVVIPFLLVFFMTGMFLILGGTCFKSIIQKNTDDRLAGRVFGVVSSVGNGSIPFAMLVYGFLLTYVEFQHLSLASGLILLPLSLFFYKKYEGVFDDGKNKG